MGGFLFFFFFTYLGFLTTFETPVQSTYELFVIATVLNMEY